MSAAVATLPDLRDGYRLLAQHILANGRSVSPRGQATRELGPVTIEVRDPRAVVPVGVGRKLNLAIGAAESCQLIGGVSDAAQMMNIAKNFAAFVEADRFRGAYGPRAHAQWPRVVRALQDDPSTRQAGVVIWRSWELAEKTTDVACTIELHFWIRDGRLCAQATMRSNDVFWGLAYDAWMFANAQVAIAKALQVDVGTYYHTTISLHAYVDRDLEKIEALHLYDGAAPPPMLADDLDDWPGDTPLARWHRIATYARWCVGVQDDGAWRMPPSFAWYRNRLEQHWSAETRFCAACRYVLPEAHFSPVDPHAFCARCEAIAERSR